MPGPAVAVPAGVVDRERVLVVERRRLLCGRVVRIDDDPVAPGAAAADVTPRHAVPAMQAHAPAVAGRERRRVEHHRVGVALVVEVHPRVRRDVALTVVPLLRRAARVVGRVAGVAERPGTGRCLLLRAGVDLPEIGPAARPVERRVGADLELVLGQRVGVAVVELRGADEHVGVGRALGDVHLRARPPALARIGREGVLQARRIVDVKRRQIAAEELRAPLVAGVRHGVIDDDEQVVALAAHDRERLVTGRAGGRAQEVTQGAGCVARVDEEVDVLVLPSGKLDPAARLRVEVPGSHVDERDVAVIRRRLAARLAGSGIEVHVGGRRRRPRPRVRRVRRGGAGAVRRNDRVRRRAQRQAQDDSSGRASDEARSAGHQPTHRHASTPFQQLTGRRYSSVLITAASP